MTAQQVEFKPQVSPTAKLVAQGQKVGIVVIDERPRDVIGYRGVGRFGAAITGKQDLSSVIRSTLQENLTRMGFASTVASSTGTRLRVEIRSLEHSVIPGLFAGNVEADAALKANCIINKAPEYEKLYRGSFREQVVVIQFAENNQRHINTALSEAVQSMLDDKELLSCLKGTQSGVNRG